jgi:hypothetical protein
MIARSRPRAKRYAAVTHRKLGASAEAYGRAPATKRRHLYGDLQELLNTSQAERVPPRSRALVGARTDVNRTDSFDWS